MDGCSQESLVFPERKVRVENGRSVDKGASISVEWSKLGVEERGGHLGGRVSGMCTRFCIELTRLRVSNGPGLLISHISRAT